MNTYKKYCPNVYLVQCPEPHEKGEKIIVTTQHGKEHECIVFNLMGKDDNYYFYSIVRADGFNAQQYAKNKADRLKGFTLNAQKKADSYWKAADEGKEFLILAEPIKIGHHSEKRHRALIQRNWNRMDKAVAFTKKAERYESKIAYWQAKENEINLSMPESVAFYEFKLEQAKRKHEGLKNGTIKKEHSYSLTYAKKEVNEMAIKLEIAKRLWA